MHFSYAFDLKTIHNYPTLPRGEEVGTEAAGLTPAASSSVAPRPRRRTPSRGRAGLGTASRASRVLPGRWAARILVLEGPDGCGKSHHTDRLAAALRAEGIDAVAFHHAKPADADPVLAALDYAAQRRRLVLAPPAEVIVADRWEVSTWALGRAMRETCIGHHGQALIDLANAEGGWAGVAGGATLDAADAVLDARLAARGTPATRLDCAMRSAYRITPRSSVYDTSRPADDVAAELLAWARGVLR